MHKVLDSFLVKLPIDTQNGVAPKVCDPPIIPHFCGFVNRQNVQKFGARFVYFSQTFCRVAQIRSGKFGAFAQKKEKPPN